MHVDHALLSELTDGSAIDARMDALEATDVATDARLDTVEASVYLPGPLVLASNAPVSLNRHADYRCTGANDHVTVQAAVDAAGTAPAYLSDGTFAFAGGVLKTAQANAPGGLVGTSRNGTVITQADDSAYVYAWESSLTSGSGAELSGPLFEKLDIRSKFGIKLGQTGVDFTTVWKLQAFLMGAKFRDLRMLGKYSAAADPNADTDNDATSAELLGYGAGISAAKCFQLLVTNCLISTFGIGAYIDGCDIAEIAQGTRLIGNARGAHFYGHDTYGGKPKVDHCDVVAQRRKGAIRFEDVVAWQITGNTYFENTLGARCYVWESGATSRDSEFSGNYVVSGGATQPWAIFSPRNHVVSNNRANGTFGPTQVDTAAYLQANPVLMRFVNNDPSLPAPTTGLVNSRPNVDPYLLSVDNFDPGNILFGTLPTAEFPWYTSPVTARQVIKPTNPTLKWRVPLRHRAHRAFEIRYTGRFLSGVADAQTVSYVEDATTTMTTGAGTLGFAKTDDVETLSQFVTLPPRRRATATSRSPFRTTASSSSGSRSSRSRTSLCNARGRCRSSRSTAPTRCCRRRTRSTRSTPARSARTGRSRSRPPTRSRAACSASPRRTAASTARSRSTSVRGRSRASLPAHGPSSCSTAPTGSSRNTGRSDGRRERHRSSPAGAEAAVRAQEAQAQDARARAALPPPRPRARPDA
jgi:hypothetical protein